MTNRGQCIGSKPAVYLRLLNFARLSKDVDAPLHTGEDISTDLNLLLAPNQSISSSLVPIYPLLYRSTMQSSLRDLISPNTLSFLKNTTYRLVATDMIQKHWLLKILTVFKNNGISVILLKGTAFSESLYSKDAPRLGVDIDLLVKKDEFDTACAVTGEIMEAVTPNSTRIATYSTLFERIFSAKKDGGPIVEIHRGLTNTHLFRINEKDLWKASREHPAFESDLVRILSPEDTLLHLAVHAFRDLDFCSHNILDAHEVWCQWNPDIDTLYLRAEQWGAKNVLYYLLLNCRIKMQTPVPETLLARLQPFGVIDSLNRKTLTSQSFKTAAKHSTLYRIKQLISQTTFPDRFWRGLKHQLSYGSTRVLDWIISLKSRWV